MHLFFVVLGAICVAVLTLIVGLIVDAVSKRREHPFKRRWIVILVSVAAVLVVGQAALQLGSEATVQGRAEPVAAPSGIRSTTSPAPSPSASGPLYGYGPKRTTYTSQHPADHPVLNSITDNGGIGDERNFLRIKLEGPTGTVAADYGKLLAVQPGDVIDVEVSVFNDAADNIGDKGTIHGLSARLIPSKVGTQVPITVNFRGRNITDQWDSSGVLATSPVKLEWVDGSAVFENVYGNIPVPDDMSRGDWQSLGSEHLDGEYRVGLDDPASLELGSGYLTFKLKVAAA